MTAAAISRTFVIVEPFMITRLHLRKSALKVYALIFGFMKMYKKAQLSLEYISAVCNISLATTKRAIRYLIDNEYIERRRTSKNHLKWRNDYSILEWTDEEEVQNEPSQNEPLKTLLLTRLEKKEISFDKNRLIENRIVITEEELAELRRIALTPWLD